MIMRRDKPFTRTICIGLCLLALANVTQWFLQRHTAMAEGPRDGLSGLLLGIAIGVMILGLWRSGRSGGQHRA